MDTSRPELKVTVFSDYICPFCYIGDARLKRLREHYDLKVNWCLLEIHPETSAQGEPIESLNYPPRQWQVMMAALENMAQEEDLVFQEHDFTTNSRSALQLAEAAKYIDAQLFYRVHERLFRWFFSEGRNIGDRRLLRELAREAGMQDADIDAAWQDAEVEDRLGQFKLAARDLGVRATPTFFIGERRLDGAVPFEQLLQAAQAA